MSNKFIDHFGKSYLRFDGGNAMGSSGRVRVFRSLARSIATTTIVVIVVALVPFASVKLVTMHSFDMFPQRRGVRVAFCTAGRLARIGFL